VTTQFSRTFPHPSDRCRFALPPSDGRRRTPIYSSPIPHISVCHSAPDALRGFGAVQWDIVLRRQFRVTERLGLQSRADFFNILNTRTSSARSTS
jgi:hypothetical protein